jgi:methionyl-tRNA synthetase
LADEEPWKVIKDNPNACNEMYVALQIVAVEFTFCEPFYPLPQKIIKNFKNRKSVELEYYCSKFDLIPWSPN